MGHPLSKSKSRATKKSSIERAIQIPQWTYACRSSDQPPIPHLPHSHTPRLRRRPSEKSGEERDGGMTSIKKLLLLEPSNNSANCPTIPQTVQQFCQLLRRGTTK